MINGRHQCDTINGCGTMYPQHVDNCPKCGNSCAFSDFIPYNPLDWVYDLETYPNIFTASFKHPNTGIRMFFEVSERRNDLPDLVGFLHALKASGCRLVGFNNVGYDYPMLHFIIEYSHAIGIADIYNKSAAIIATPWDDRYNNVVWDNDVHIQQIDLSKIHHFDNKARMTSLKMLEFNMRSRNIEDLPFTPGIPLTLEQIPGLCKYNDHDVDETEKFYFETLEMIEFREELGARHNQNFLNHSDKKIGTALFVDALESASPGSCYIRVGGRKTKRQTIRTSIFFGDIIFPYIQFERRELQLVIQWLKTFTITQTKGALEYLDVPFEMALNMNRSIIRVHGLTPDDVPSMVNVKNLKNLLKKGPLLSAVVGDMRTHNNPNQFKYVSGWKDQSGLNVVVDGFRFDFGTGGIHGSIDSTTVYSDDDCELWDWDVGAYYPSLGVVNKMYPEHLSETFCDVDLELKAERAKHAKGTPLNKAIKLARNGAYGDSNNQHSPLFDSQYTMSITINGQLLLCLLSEHLLKIPGLTMVQANTDGVTVKCPRQYIQHMKDVCAWWEKFTCLELESVVYSRMFIKDVNNYIGEYADGGVKRKGAYEYKLDWHQNHSALVVPRAAEAALVHGADVAEFIRGHDDIFDFMYRTKVGRADQLVICDQSGNEKRLQNITRYYIGVEGGAMFKISPPAKGAKVGSWKRATKLTDYFYEGVQAELSTEDWTTSGLELDSTGLPWDERINTKNRSTYEIRRTGFNVGRLVAPCNDIRDADFSNIDYDHYIAEAMKLVDPLR